LRGAGHIPRTKIDIRCATEDDLYAVEELWYELAKHHQMISPRFMLALDGRSRWSKYLRERFSEISTRLIVADEGGEIIGFMLCMLEPNVPIYRERKLGVVSDVYVAEERRRRGVAKAMFDLAVKWFRKNKVRTVRLNVAADNHEARAAWRRLGFEPLMIDKRLDLDRYPPQRSLKRPARVVRTRQRRRPLVPR